MTPKTLYDVLGVSQSATLEQIRGAYRIRVTMFHPDRFDQSRQPKEWQLANEMLKALNSAYEVLSDPTCRRDYDATLKHRSESEQDSAPNAKPATSGSRRDRSPVRSGSVCFDDFPDAVKKRLSERISGGKKKAFQFQVGSAGVPWFWACVLLGWVIVLSKFSDDMHRHHESFWWLIGITAVVALLHGSSFGSILRWHSSPCGCWILVTPLHFVRIQFHEVRYWPIWEMEDFKCVHVYRNGSYEGTDFLLAFSSGSDSFRLPKKRLAEEFIATLQNYDNKLRESARNENWKYFCDEDDFADFTPPIGNTAAKQAAAKREKKQQFAGYVAAAGLWLALVPLTYGMGSGNNSMPSFTTSSQPPSRSTSPYIAPPSPQFRQPTVTQFNEPELPMPRTGEVIEYGYSERVAPFEIKSSVGSNYLVKLVDSGSQRPILTVFVRGGTTVNVDVPLGNYIVKYAAGDRWYGYEHLFGPETGYNKASTVFSFSVIGNRISGYTITLYKVRDGNLHTNAIRKEEF